MGNLSLVFHLASLVVLIGLALWALRLQIHLRVWREWNARHGSGKVLVGEPLRVLRQFATAIGAGFESDFPVNAFGVVRLSLDSCFELHRTGRIDRIVVSKEEIPRVDFVLGYEPSTMSVDLDKLKRELGGAFAIGITVSRENQIQR